MVKKINRTRNLKKPQKKVSAFLKDTPDISIITGSKKEVEGYVRSNFSKQEQSEITII